MSCHSPTKLSPGKRCRHIKKLASTSPGRPRSTALRVSGEAVDCHLKECERRAAAFRSSGWGWRSVAATYTRDLLGPRLPECSWTKRGLIQRRSRLRTGRGGRNGRSGTRRGPMAGARARRRARWSRDLIADASARSIQGDSRGSFYTAPEKLRLGRPTEERSGERRESKTGCSSSSPAAVTRAEQIAASAEGSGPRMTMRSWAVPNRGSHGR